MKAGRITGGPAARLLAWGPLILAVLIGVLILIPAEVWRAPADDAVYEGIDPFLIYADRRGGAASSGAVDVSPEAIRLVALPNARPTVTLATTPLRKLRLEMDIRVIERGPGTIPFRLGIWSPATKSGYFLEFGPALSSAVSASYVRNGTVGATLSMGESTSPHILGSYQVGVAYRLTAVIDKDADRVSFRLASREAPPSGHRMLRIAGHGYPLYASQVFSDPVRVTGGTPYWFGGSFKHLSGGGTFGFVVEWIDRQGRRISTTEEWRHVASLVEWSDHAFQAVAPPGATTARLLLGTSPGTEAFFADPFLSPNEDASASLLTNPTFTEGPRGWQSAAVAPVPLEILDPTDATQEATLPASQAPDLLRELRLAVTANAYSEAGTSTVDVSNYRLSLPHQRWLVVRVDDPRTKSLVVLFLLVALGLSAAAAVPPAARAWQEARRRFAFRDRPPWDVAGWSVVAGISVLGLYALLNVPLFNAGSLNYDLKSATVWLYAIPRYGLSQLYHLPAIVGPADAWGGVPVQEATFPYGPMLADVFAAVAWLHQIFVGLPGRLQEDSFRFAFSIKLATMLFTAASAVVIGLILKARGVSRRGRVIGAAVFLLNPGVIFVGSVWGQTQTISTFFLLLPILAISLRKPQAAWVTLGLAALTRPQLYIPIILIALYLMLRFRPADTVRGLAWGLIAGFIVMAPVALTIGPSVPVDLFANAFRLHIEGQNSPLATPVSWGALSIWTLLTGWKDGHSGLERLSVSSKEMVVGRLTYWDLGNLLFGAVLLLCVVSVLRRSREGPGALLPALGLGTLGLFILKPSFGAFHLIPALPFVILWGEGYGRRAHLWAVALLSITIFLPAYGMAGVWMGYHPSWNIGIFAPDQFLTRAVVTLFTRDWFLTVGSAANLAVLAILAARTIGGPSRPS